MRLCVGEVDQYVEANDPEIRSAFRFHGNYSLRFEADDMEKKMTQNDVLIIGAGPTGLVLALWLTRLGV